ncbi:aminoacyl-tRNA hydrolase [candidate division WWE3 bacterium]|uniref:Peptidyl-tRNA hydrolase n=1 Tax=candidate division WWE3 bacterium TaxID=2053526 RepID=A0A955LHV4_UNCKA|nr:aminoacyl-tRNA hydrolase [candidate division WWE3 bacterium]
MKMIIGLGNPLDEYKSTRHNVGEWVVNNLADESRWQHHRKANVLWQEISIQNENVTLVLPQDYMNNSGRALKKYASDIVGFDLDTVLIVHDDWAFDIGEYRLDFDRGPNRHNGVRDIISRFGTQAFWRLRIGIGGERSAERDSASDYVLATFTKGEEKILTDLFENQLINVITEWINQN